MTVDQLEVPTLPDELLHAGHQLVPVAVQVQAGGHAPHNGVGVAHTDQ